MAETLEVDFVDEESGIALLDRQARKYLDMSGPEFIRQYRSGEIDSDRSDVIRVAMLLPFAGEPLSGRQDP